MLGHLEYITSGTAVLAIAGAMADAAQQYNLPRAEGLLRSRIDNLLDGGKMMVGDIHVAVHDPTLVDMHDPTLVDMPSPDELRAWEFAVNGIAQAAYASSPQVFMGRVAEMPRNLQRLVASMLQGPTVASR